MNHPNSKVQEAAERLRRGELVGFPTETVYGLGADARNAEAVRKVFLAKNRPAGNPLIVHVFDEASARNCASSWPASAHLLALRFWPGPLTIVVPRSQCIVPEVCAGGTTVGLRSPDHPLAQAMLRAFDGPVAAPSANRSNRISPTTAEHVRQELGEAVNLVLDGGPCTVGIESTVVDLSGGPARILRPGAITRTQIQEVIGEPVDSPATSADPISTLMSPGQLPVHYSPTTSSIRFSEDEQARVIAWLDANPGLRVQLLLRRTGAMRQFVESRQLISSSATWLSTEPAEYARGLYASLREADQSGADVLLIEIPLGTEAWAAVHDRVRRATQALQG